MAKRRRLETPSADELSRIEEEFRRETSARPEHPTAPIAQVAAESAGMIEVQPLEARTEAARDRADAAALRAALAEGLVIQEVPLARIVADSMIRDRTVMDESEMDELVNSIAAHGLRLPIEIYPLAEPAGQGRFGLLSGYRRFLAMERLCQMMGGTKFDTIKAIVRDPDTMGGAFVAMVEENEVRSTLSPFERGRIAVIAAQNGAFVNAEAAVDTLYASASKAKRSKIRSFAQVFEELGDLLRFPENLTERQGLKIATALRAGGERRLRAAMERGQGASPEEEWAVLDAAMADADSAPRDVRRGGRPRKAAPPPAGWEDERTLHLSTGWTLRADIDSRGPLIRIEGRSLAPDLLEDVMEAIRRRLEYKG
ncbi:ParB N-terminal domain-containing protein [Tropicimonas sp. IMCC34043]|uniref:ParB/RepB/Spo0J family partition protein n=1 Tax=Tropicimonas sp. IMCC34043 TaxID=2248760 RepID=UPI000E25812B|nr:ParB N-terminal domain-containing protein [Tropicimonas sp. IMCC34043]